MGTYSKDLQTRISNKFNENLLVEIIQNLLAYSDCIVNDIAFNNDSKKGDSYLSTIIRFVVTGTGTDKRTKDSKNFVLPAIAKCLPANICRRITFRSLDFFRNEVIFYNTVWKAMDDFQKSKIPGGVFNEIPLCISAFADGNNDYVILEDLSYKKYIGLSRGKDLDLIHTQCVLEVFAKFHAISLAFKDQQSKQFEDVALSLEETYFAEKFRPWYIKFLTGKLYNIMEDAIIKQLPKRYLDKFKKLIENDFFGTLIDHCSTRGRLSVITHGDAWLPNFLFKYDNSETPCSAAMIDFQLARYASLANDVTFFLYSCTEESLRIEHWDNLIEHYHKTFVKTLESLGSDPNLLTLDDLKNEIKANAVFGIGMSMEAVVMALLEDDEAADLDAIQGDHGVPLETIWAVVPFKEEQKRQRYANMIKHAVDNGFI